LDHEYFSATQDICVSCQRDWRAVSDGEEVLEAVEETAMQFRKQTARSLGSGRLARVDFAAAMRRLLFSAVALALSACAHHPAVYSSTNGKTHEQFRGDLARCEAQSKMEPPPGANPEAFSLDNCLKAEGWVRMQ
jgi:hypothetical protein